MHGEPKRLSDQGLVLKIPGVESHLICVMLTRGWACCLLVFAVVVVQSLSCDRLLDCNSTPGSSVLHCLPEFTQTHVHWVSEAILPSYPLLPASPFALNLSQHQGLFQSWLFTSDSQSRVQISDSHVISSKAMKCCFKSPQPIPPFPLSIMIYQPLGRKNYSRCFLMPFFSWKRGGS